MAATLNHPNIATVYDVLDEDGRAVVLKPGAPPEPLAVNVLEGPTLASIAVSAKSLFIRSGTHLYRLANAE